MLRVLGPGLVGLMFLAFWIYCVINIITTEELLIRNLPKVTWLILVIFVPLVGSVAWIAAGRPQYTGAGPGAWLNQPPRRAAGPEDEPGFGGGPRRSSLDDDRLQRWEDDLARREDDLRNGESDPVWQKFLLLPAPRPTLLLISMNYFCAPCLRNSGRH